MEQQWHCTVLLSKVKCFHIICLLSVNFFDMHAYTEKHVYYVSLFIEILYLTRERHKKLLFYVKMNYNKLLSAPVR